MNKEEYPTFELTTKIDMQKEEIEKLKDLIIDLMSENDLLREQLSEAHRCFGKYYE